jgi:hypothetical protein
MELRRSRAPDTGTAPGAGRQQAAAAAAAAATVPGVGTATHVPALRAWRGKAWRWFQRYMRILR